MCSLTIEYLYAARTQGERERERDIERYKFLSRDKSVAHFKTNFEPIPKQWGTKPSFLHIGMFNHLSKFQKLSKKWFQFSNTVLDNENYYWPHWLIDIGGSNAVSRVPEILTFGGSLNRPLWMNWCVTMLKVVVYIDYRGKRIYQLLAKVKLTSLSPSYF